MNKPFGPRSGGVCESTITGHKDEESDGEGHV
jgi:hypothetical protein